MHRIEHSSFSHISRSWRSPQLVFAISSSIPVQCDQKIIHDSCHLCLLQTRQSKQLAAICTIEICTFLVIIKCFHNCPCAVLTKTVLFSPPSSCRQSACHWSRRYRQSPMRIQESKSANCESAHQAASFWKGVSWEAVSSRSSSTLWPPRDTPLKSSSSSPPSLVEM